MVESENTIHRFFIEKEKKYMKKKYIVISVIIVFSLICSNMIGYCNSMKAVAKSRRKECTYYTNGNNLLDKYDKSSSLCKKLKHDYDNTTGVLKKDIEKNLNTIGIFDSEIEEMDTQLIDSLNNCNEYSVVVTYSEQNKDGEWEDMDSSEVDDYIEEKFPEEISDQKSKDIFELFSAGVKKASAKTVEDGWNTSNSGKVKQYIVMTDYAGTKDVRVAYTVHWIKEPTNRDNDVIGITLTNMAPCRSTWSGSYSYTIHDIYTNIYNAGKIVDTKKIDKLPVSNTKNASNGMATTVDLYSSREQLLVRRASGALVESILDDKIHISFDCNILDRKSKVVACGSYMHSTKNYCISPSISFGIDAAEIQVTGTKNTHFELITNNPVVSGSFSYK